MDYIIVLEFMVIIACLLVGARYGGYGLGLISGLGLLVFAFVFHLAPGKPPVDVLLTIMAVIGCASVLQTAGGLNVMMRVAEKILRRHPQVHHRARPHHDLDPHGHVRHRPCSLHDVPHHL